MDMMARTRIKICGLKSAEMARATVESGADAIGLVFYPKSPRNVSIELAAQIVSSLPAFTSSVALFVDAEPEFVRSVLAHTTIDLLQFHGDESPEYCRSFDRPYIKAVRVQPEVDLLQYARRYSDSRGLLCDAYHPDAPGGTGERFDWQLLPGNLPLPLILSGGLAPDNVAQAIKATKPWAVDVSSGVERSKGVKDIDLVKAFIGGVIDGSE